MVNTLKLPWKDKANPYKVQNLEGSSFSYDNGRITKELDHLKVFVEGRNEGISFDVIPVANHALVLGYPWLKRVNPMINWRTGQVNFDDVDDHSSWESDSDDDTRSQTSTDDGISEVSAKETTETFPPRGTKYKHRKARNSKTRRTIAFVRSQLTKLDKDLAEMKKQPEADERLKNIPPAYRIYKKLFAEELETGLPEHSEWDHEIVLKDGTSPKFFKLYNLNDTQLQTLKEYLEDMLKKGHIKISKSSAGYPVMFVPKKNGKLRLVVDYRQLNDITLKDRTPLPLITELKDRLHGKKWFTALDLKNAYGLVRIKPGDEWKTAFRTKFGLFEYLVMPFGLTNAPATFQRMITNVLREHLDIFVVCYLDDILIFSETEEEHAKHVHTILQKLQDAKLLVEPTKSKFHAQEVDFLGHTIRPNEIRMDKKKIEAVKDWPRPDKSVKEVQSFLGFANYYRRFIRGFSKIAKPLTELTKKDVNFRWNAKAQKAFNDLKRAILSEPVLATFDPRRPIELETDASNFALGAQIGQRDDEGNLHPIAFYSCTLKGAELNYPIYDKEFLAIVNSFKEFRHYLLGSEHQVTVYTDHKNISHFATTQELSGRQLRYAEYLSEFDYVIIHKKGSENGRADAISRRPDFEVDIPKANEQILAYTPEGHLKQKYIAAISESRLPEDLLERLQKPEQSFEQWIHDEQPAPRELLWQEGKAVLTGSQGSQAIAYFHQGNHHGNPWTLAKKLSQHFHGDFTSACISHMGHCDRCPHDLIDQHAKECWEIGDHRNCEPNKIRKKLRWVDELDKTAQIAATVSQETLHERIKDYNQTYEMDRVTGAPCPIPESQLGPRRLRVPPELQEQLVRDIHDHPLHGHLGINKTIERVKTAHTFPSMKRIVTEVIKSCELCNKTKARRHKPYGELQPLPVAERPWDSITMDFITKLPLSEDPASGTFYDSILVIVDRFTKFSYFIPYQESTDAEQFAYLFLRNIVSVHGLPTEILSDRGPPFTSKFWQALMAQLGLNHRLTTAFRPQVDGQTERMNQVLEQYLRCYINYEQNNWVEKLPTAQLSYNTATNESTKLTPCYANFGFTPDVYRQQYDGVINPKAILTSDKLKNLHEEMKTELEFVRGRMKKYYDQKRLKGPSFSKGDMVLLATKNLSTDRPSKKLDYKYIGPYEVLEKISENNYRLDLKTRHHPVFHISLLESTENTILVNNGQSHEPVVEDPEEYHVEEIRDMKKIDGKTMYLIKWKDYPESETSWQPPENLIHAQRLLKTFHAQRRKTKKQHRNRT